MKHPKTKTFAAEQAQVRDDMLRLLPLTATEFDPDVKTTTLLDLDEESCKNNVIELLPRVKQYFTIRNKAMIYTEETKRLHMTLIRFVLQPTYKIIGKFVYEGDKKTTRYYFYPLKTTQCV